MKGDDRPLALTRFRSRFVLEPSAVDLVCAALPVAVRVPWPGRLETVRLSPKTVSGGEFGWGGTSMKR